MSIKLKTILKSLFILAVFALAINTFASWTAPTLSAPNGNIPPPVNTGTDPQMKSGAFAAGGLRSFGIGLFDGQVGIGTTSPGVPIVPTQPLDVIGNVKFSGALMPNGNAGEVGQVLTSGGSTGYPTWGPSMTNPMTTIGDIIYASTTGTPSTATRLGIGTLGQVLTVDASGVPSWATASGGSYWSRTSATPFYTYLTNSGDKVGIGTSTPSQQLQLTGNFEIPNTNSSATTGIIYKGGYRFLHDYGTFDPTGGTKKQSIFMGANAGNLGTNSSCLSNNIGIGIEALKSITSSSGSCALPAASGNVGIGNIALTNLTTGTNNTAVGPSSAGSVTTGQNNVGVGTASLSSSQTTSSGNVGVGYWAGVGVGDGGTYVGAYACNQITAAGGTVCTLPTGITNNTAIGYQTKIVGQNIVNSTALGNGATVAASNKIVLGNASATTVGGYGTWTNYSDARLKENIVYKDDLGLDFIMGLKTASFNYKDDKNKTRRDGLIAQDVQQVMKDLNVKFSGLVIDDDDMKTMNLSYDSLVIPLINSVQEQQKEIEDLKAEIEILKNK